MKKTFLVLGLGIFGSTIAKELSLQNHDVIVIDKDMTCVERLQDIVSHGVCADFNDIEQLKAVGVDDVDIAIVASGSRLEDSVMAVMNLKELGVPYVLAKAKNKKYSQILSKIGCDRIINPEKEIGIKTAKSLASLNIIDLIELDKEYNIVEIAAPKSWVGKTLIDLELRNKFNINVLGIRLNKGEHLNLVVDPNIPIEAENHILMICENSFFKNFQAITK